MASDFPMLLSVCKSQTVTQNSKCGRTSVLNAIILMSAIAPCEVPPQESQDPVGCGSNKAHICVPFSTFILLRCSVIIF